jgi:signal transduction histidine kinase
MLLTQPKRGKGPELNDWQVEALQSIDRSTARLVELTEDLLDVTRLQGGGLELHPEPTDLVALTQRMVRRLQVTTTHHSISIMTALPYVVVSVDPGRIEQVLSNLIGNAIKYSPQGGPIEISISEELDRQAVRLSIRDAGIGIPVSEQMHIFRRFACASNSSNYGITGTGLGLYLCRELVERHDGRIWFESNEGHGSNSFMLLPLFQDDAGRE